MPNSNEILFGLNYRKQSNLLKLRQGYSHHIFQIMNNLFTTFEKSLLYLSKECLNRSSTSIFKRKVIAVNISR